VKVLGRKWAIEWKLQSTLRFPSIRVLGGIEVGSESFANYRFRWVFGTAISVGLATLLIFLGRATHQSALIPVLFLVVTMLCARYFGIVAGILGSIAATSLFALFLFKPYGSFAIDDPKGLPDLALMLFAGIALSYANSERIDKPETPPSSLRSR
jgi:K+-sensing histidine kinase KdpD